MITLANIERLVKTENNTVIVNSEEFCWIFYVTLTRKAYDGESTDFVFYAYSEEMVDNEGLLTVTIAKDFEKYIKDRFDRDFYYTIKYKVKTIYFESDIQEL